MALRRKQAPATRRDRSTPGGTGAGEYKVKGKRATARQREVIDGALEQASEDKASRRVMIGLVMALTQESRCGEEPGKGKYRGPLHQSDPWGSEEERGRTKSAVHSFLVTGPTSWKKVHGGVKKAPGNLGAAIDRVQGAGTPAAYSQWEEEATRTVDAWRENGGSEEGGGSYVKRYTFTRGEKGGSREDSWDAADRLVKEVGAYRWAAGNVFYAASGDELRRGGPSLMIEGDEGWLRKGLAWSWASRRSISEMKLEVLADRWDVMPGGVVSVHRRHGPMSGKWLVFTVEGSSLDSPEATVTLRRPTRLKSEPPSERADRNDEDGDEGGDKTVERLREVCREISDNRHEYDWGGSHGPKVRTLKASSPFDCSSSVSYALYRAGFFNGDKPAYVSGTFAAQWGSPGKGEEFTVWANGEHVWIEFADGARFDTSQHGGKSGPAYTTKKRSDQGRFTARHYGGH